MRGWGIDAASRPGQGLYETAAPRKCAWVSHGRGHIWTTIIDTIHTLGFLLNPFLYLPRIMEAKVIS
jgi:hypothetical protein